MATIDSRLDPDAFTGDSTTMTVVANNANTLVNFVLSTPSPADPCLYIGGPTAGQIRRRPDDADADAGRRRRTAAPRAAP